MSDYPMLISNKLHSFRNFLMQRYNHPTPNTKKSVQIVHYFCPTAHTRPTVGASNPTSLSPYYA